LTTGEGGMLTTSNASLATRLRLARSHGELTRYHHVRLGFNFLLTDMAAALGREQLRKLPWALQRRRRNAAFLARGLAGVPGLRIPLGPEGIGHAFTLFTVLLDPKILRLSRDEFQRALLRRGVETAVHYPLPLHHQPILRGLGTDRDFPVSTRLAHSVLSLPVHPGLSDAELRHIVRCAREVAAQRRR
jgi:perosamine synthetase